MKPSPQRLLQLGMAFCASKTLLSAVELGLFTALGGGLLTAPQIAERLGLHRRGLYDFLDALLSLGLLDRQGNGPEARYANTSETARFLDERSPAYVGGILAMASVRLYPLWGALTPALRTGQPQLVQPPEGAVFDGIYADRARREQFIAAMQSIQRENFEALLQKVDLSQCTRLLDVGGADATLSILAAGKHPGLHCLSMDLPAVQPIARALVERTGLAGRIELVAGDFFTGPLPRADVITMGNVLHDWDESQKQQLIVAAHTALPPGGRLIVIENIIDDERRYNAFGLLMSLDMLLEMPGGFDYTGAQFDVWCKRAGFQRTEMVALAGATSAAIAHKQA